MTQTHELHFTSLRPAHLTNVLIGNGSLKRTNFIAIFEVLYLPAVSIIVLCYWFLFVYVFRIIAFDLYRYVKTVVGIQYNNNKILEIMKFWWIK